MNRLDQAKARIAYFEVLLQQPKDDSWTFVTPNWKQLYLSQIEYWQGVLNGADGNFEYGPGNGSVVSADAAGVPEPNCQTATEERWARVMNNLGVEMTYQTPMFWLPGSQNWLQITGSQSTSSQIEIARQRKQSTGRRVYIAAGEPAPGRFALAIISERGDFWITRPLMCVIALSNLWKVKLSTIEQAMRGNNYGNKPQIQRPTTDDSEGTNHAGAQVGRDQLKNQSRPVHRPG